MKKKSFLKKFFHVFVALVLLLVLLGRCSRFQSSDSSGSSGSSGTTTSYKFVSEDEYLKSFNTSCVKSSFILSASASELDLTELQTKTRYATEFCMKPLSASLSAMSYTVGYALEHPQISAGESYATVLPAYTLVGKIRLVYSSSSWELITCYANFQGDNNSSSWFPTWDADYLSNVGIYPQTLLYIRQNSSGNVTSFELALSSMPYVYNSGSSVYWNARTASALLTSYPGLVGYGGVTASDGTSVSINLSTSQNYYFRTNTVNSIDRSFDVGFIPTNNHLAYGDYSLTTYYCSYCVTNDQELYGNLNYSLSVQNNSYPQSSFPIFLMGLKKGLRITKNNVNNYNDYGITFDVDNNTFNYDYSVANNYYNTTVTNQFLQDYNNVYSLQPGIGDTFNSPNNIYNYVDLSPPVLYPDSGGGSSGLPDSWLSPYPPIQTQPNITVELVSAPTATIDADLSDKMVAISKKGFDIFDCFGLAAPCIAIAVFGVVYKRFID